MNKNDIDKKELVKIEGNVCEYPFFILSKSTNSKDEEEKKRRKHCRELNLGTVISEDGSIEERKLIMRTPENVDLPSAFEQDILMAISYIGTKNNTLTGRIHFSLHELAKLLGKMTHKAKIKEGIKKMAHVTCEAIHTVLVKKRNGETHYLTGEEIFHIFGRTSFWDKKRDKISNRRSKEVTWVTFNEYFLENFLSGYFQYIDLTKYIELGSPVAKRLYIFLSKKRFGKSEFKISITKLASILPIESKRTTEIRRILKRACERLEKAKIITGYELKKRAMNITFYFPDEKLKSSGVIEERETLKLPDEKQKIYEHLIETGVTAGVVKQLIQDHPTEKIEQQLKWLTSRQIDDPAGALVSSIRYDWAPPKEILKDKENEETQKQVERILKRANNTKYIVLPSGKKRQILKVSDNVIEFIDENERRMIPTNQALNCKFED